MIGSPYLGTGYEKGSKNSRLDKPFSSKKLILEPQDIKKILLMNALAKNH